MTTPILETKRLILRPGKVSDAEAVYNNWASDPDVAKFMRWNVHGSIDDTIAWLADGEAGVADENKYNWFFVHKEANEPIGSGGVFYNNTHDMFEIGYCIAKRYWGQGLTSEAAKEILRFTTQELGKTKLFACCAYENPASGRILEKLGFVYKGDGEYSSFDGQRVFKSREYFLNV